MGSSNAMRADADEPPEPKYYRLKRAVVADLLATTPPGGPIPPERVLAERLGASRTTLRRALQELVGEGRLHRRQGSGTFVAPAKVAQRLQLTSYTEDMVAQGLRPTSRLLDVSTIKADAELARRLDIRRGMRVTRIERVRLGDGRPMAIETTHLATARFPDVAGAIAEAGSLYGLLRERHGLELASAEETIETAVARPREARLLETEIGVPMLLLSRHSFDRDGRPFEWVRSVYRGDRYKFVATLSRAPPRA
jgi:GntR family transcriptional regulator